MASDHERRVRWMVSDNNEVERIVPQGDDRAILIPAEDLSPAPDHTRRVTVISRRSRNSSFDVQTNTSAIHQRRATRNRNRSENIPRINLENNPPPASRVEEDFLGTAASTLLPPSPDHQVLPPPPSASRRSGIPTLRSRLRHTDDTSRTSLHTNGTATTPTVNGTTTTSSPLPKSHVRTPASSPN